jgi:hypothetical protein
MKRVEHACACATCRAHPYAATAKEHSAINRVLATLNEKSRRRFVGLLAQQWGRGGIERLSEITGLSRPTIRRGRAEIQQAEGSTEQNRVRRAGAGRLRVEKNSRVF